MKIINLKVVRSLKNRFQSIIAPEPVLLGSAAIAVGLFTGIGIWIFKQMISMCQTLMFGTYNHWLKPVANWSVVFLPILGGLIVGLISHFFIGKEKYHGLPGIIEACALSGGKLPYQKMPVRIIASAISIGSGASVGPEDPSVQVGSNIGSMLGQWFHFSEDRVRALVAGGAAAGIASAFNAPVAGVFFALEVLLGELNGSSFAFAAISSVIASVFTQAVSGSQPAFIIPQYSFSSAWELPLYLLLGLIAGPLAATYIRLITFSRNKFHDLNVPDWVKPVIAGFLVGLTGIFLPQILGVGYETIGEILQFTSMPLLLLVALLIAKLIMTPVSIGGGFVGGVFAPSLYLGATLGYMSGEIFRFFLPSLGISSPAFAMVGMAAVLAGTVHAPLTAVLLLFEMTRDYRIILPLMFAVAISFIVSRKIQKDSIYRLPLAQNGLRFEGGRDIEVMEGIAVREVMNTDIQRLKENDPISVATTAFAETRSHGLPVFNRNDELVGMITLQDIEQANSISSEQEEKTIGNLCTHDLVVVYPEDSIGTALKRMSVRDIGQLPVVASNQTDHLLGLLRRNDVIRAYEMALVRRNLLRYRAQEIRLSTLSRAKVQEVTVLTGSSCAYKQIKAIKWPRDCVISSIRRGSTGVIPHGDTTLLPQDVLIVVSEGDALQDVNALCQKPSKSDS